MRTRSTDAIEARIQEFVHFLARLFRALPDDVDLAIGDIPARPRLIGNILGQSRALGRGRQNFLDIVGGDLHPHQARFHFEQAAGKFATHPRRLPHAFQPHSLAFLDWNEALLVEPALLQTLPIRAFSSNSRLLFAMRRSACSAALRCSAPASTF